MKKPRPDYEALDSIGLPYMRKARVIGELSPADTKEALAEATAAVAELIGVKACSVIKYGTPAFLAMTGMNRNMAKRHAHAHTLLSCGCDLSLDLCASYAPQVDEDADDNESSPVGESPAQGV